MKLSRCLFSLLSAMWLVGCGADHCGTFSPEQSQNSIVEGRLKIGGLPVVNTQVRLRLDGQVLATATSDEFGSFVFDLRPVSSKLSNSVVAKGTHMVDVTATVDGARYSSVLENGPEFVWVTEITTLVHDYLEAHPEASFEQADAAVGRSILAM